MELQRQKKLPKGEEMTIEQFEKRIEKINGRGKWFEITYHSLYKEKAIKIETKELDFICVGITFNEAFTKCLDLLLLSKG